MLNRILNDPNVEIHDVTALTEFVLRISLKDKSEKAKQPLTNSVPLGMFLNQILLFKILLIFRRFCYKPGSTPLIQIFVYCWL